jgi:hypothetical protein
MVIVRPDEKIAYVNQQTERAQSQVARAEKLRHALLAV